MMPSPAFIAGVISFLVFYALTMAVIAWIRISRVRTMTPPPSEHNPDELLKACGFKESVLTTERHVFTAELLPEHIAPQVTMEAGHYPKLLASVDNWCDGCDGPLWREIGDTATRVQTLYGPRTYCADCTAELDRTANVPHNQNGPGGRDG